MKAPEKLRGVTPGKDSISLFFPPPPGPHVVDLVNEADRAELSRLVAGSAFGFEIGTFLGGTAETILRAMPGRLVCVDTFKGTPGTCSDLGIGGPLYRYASERLGCFGDRVSFITATSAAAAEFVRRRSADFVFIDAAHDYENVLADIAGWRLIVKPGGLLIGHDFLQRSPKKLTWGDICARSTLEIDPETGAHCGVIRAVVETFGMPHLSEDRESSIWHVRIV